MIRGSTPQPRPGEWVRGHRTRNVEQLVARAVWDREAGGSSPFIPTWRLGFDSPAWFCSSIGRAAVSKAAGCRFSPCQDRKLRSSVVERLPDAEDVAGSTPAATTGKRLTRYVTLPRMSP